MYDPGFPLAVLQAEFLGRIRFTREQDETVGERFFWNYLTFQAFSPNIIYAVFTLPGSPPSLMDYASCLDYHPCPPDAMMDIHPL